ncbi:MAG: hypothetical protein ABSD43_17050 [Terracidiphilus sp.]|jgi:hypothetical protein
MATRAVFFAALLAVDLAGFGVASGQVVPSADSGGLKLTVGATATGYSLDYGERKMLGVAAIADADTNRRIGIEAEAGWLIFRQTANVHTATYLIGPRCHLTFGRFQPYAKGLVGFGRFSYPYSLGQDKDLVIAPGGGVDFRLTRRVRLRLADFEYQYWPQFHFGALSSFGVSSGVRVRIF